MTLVMLDIFYLSAYLIAFWVGIIASLNYLFIFIPFHYSFTLSVIGGCLMGFSAAKLKTRFEGRGW